MIFGEDSLFNGYACNRLFFSPGSAVLIGHVWGSLFCFASRRGLGGAGVIVAGPIGGRGNLVIP